MRTDHHRVEHHRAEDHRIEDHDYGLGGIWSMIGMYVCLMIMVHFYLYEETRIFANAMGVMLFVAIAIVPLIKDGMKRELYFYAIDQLYVSRSREMRDAHLYNHQLFLEKQQIAPAA